MVVPWREARGLMTTTMITLFHAVLFTASYPLITRLLPTAYCVPSTAYDIVCVLYPPPRLRRGML